MTIPAPLARYGKEVNRGKDTTIKRVSFVCMDEENCFELSKQIKQAYTVVE